jgi:putative AdoMet-dependent methyltransferase
MLDNIGFDLWADGYDKSVNLCEDSDEYPFAGYKNVLNDIYKQVRERENAEVLDIGFGTGLLTTQLYNAGCAITGVDFSAKMISIAQQKMPDATLINYDFSQGLPDKIKNHHYDYILSTYAIHHLTDSKKIIFLESLSHLLKPNGKILIGDISFVTRDELEECKEKYNDCWDCDEIYIVAEELIDKIKSNFYCVFTKKSFCAGILIIRPLEV